MQGMVTTPETNQMALYGALWLKQLVLPPPPKADRRPVSHNRTLRGLYARVSVRSKMRAQLKQTGDPTGGCQGSLSPY